MQKLQLSIPEPCHENWQNMTATEQGRFCNACAKEVIDFSTMTDIQVLNYFTNLTHEKVCGRALPEQLDRTLSRPEQPKKRLFWYWNYIAMFFMFFTKGNSAKAQTCSKPATELNPVKNMDIKGEMMTLGKVQQGYNRIITGKVTDKDGNAVPFASVKIKGTTTGVSADANGAYSIKVNANAILIISGAGFEEAEVTIGTRSVLNTTLEKAASGRIVFSVGMISNSFYDSYTGPDKTKNIAVIKVKDEQTTNALDNARVVITKSRKSDTAFTDQKGTYRLKGVTEYGSYFIKVMAEGYESNEFTIDGSDFKDRKKEWEVLLRKQKAKTAKPTPIANPRSETGIILGGVSGISSGSVLYVVDDKIVDNANYLKAEDIEDYFVLQGEAASALYGTKGQNGVIVITTRKAKEIKMKEVVVTSDLSNRRMAGGMTYTTTYINSYLGDTIATVKALLTDSIKVYPNPVERNHDFSVQLKLKKSGNNYSMLITDASGKILLQKKINATSKDHTEKITGDRRWAAGIYYIRIFDDQNKLISKSSFVFQ